MNDPTPAELQLGDLQAVIRDYEQNLTRTLQVEIGPSQLGEPCTRKLAMQLLGAPDINPDRDQWPATVGTAVHELLANAFRRNNRTLTTRGKTPRWLIEQPVTIRTGLIGHTDLIDLYTWTVIDHKNVSVASLRTYRKKGHPGQQYETQAHLYGLGWTRAGLPIKKVAIAFYPKSGMMRDSWMWTADYDETIALAALERMDTLLTGANTAELSGYLGPYLQTLPRDTSHCEWCQYFRQELLTPSEEPATHCAGQFEDPDHVDDRPPSKWTAPGIFR